MRAAVVPGFGQELIIEDRPVPEPGPGQVVIRMEASGLCHTDIHAASGDWPVKPAPPFVPGHEGVGIVTAVGEGVTSPVAGTRVAVPWLGYACGNCRYCLTGWETLCESQQMTGYTVDGCFAEYFRAEAAFATPVPDGIDPREAAPLTCAGVTTYKAVKVGNVRPGDLVLVSGIGGLGHLALQYARIFGGTVAAVDITDEKLKLAADLGADIVIDARSQDPAEVLRRHGGADVAIGLAVDDKSFATAYSGLRRGGRLVLVALPAAGTLRIPVFDTVLNGTSVIGSSSAPVPTWRRPSPCTPPAGPGRATRRGRSPASTRPSTTCCTARPGAAWSWNRKDRGRANQAERPRRNGQAALFRWPPPLCDGDWGGREQSARDAERRTT